MLSNANRTAWTVAALAILALAQGGCATSIADMPLIGVPSDAPARPKDPAAYPAVEDLPAPREDGAMDPTEQAKVAKELIAARDRQAAVAPNGQAAGAPKAGAPKPAAAKPKAHPPSQSSSESSSESKPQQ
jgi:hypothetical protein